MYFSGVYSRSAAEVPSVPLPVGGTDRLQAGGSVAVVGRDQHPSLHEVSSHPVALCLVFKMQNQQCSKNCTGEENKRRILCRSTNTDSLTLKKVICSQNDLACHLTILIHLWIFDFYRIFIHIFSFKIFKTLFW